MTSPADDSRSTSTASRLSRQMDFVLEIDRLKGILRQTILLDKSRLENAAEHSWHIAVMARLLHEYAVERVIEILLVHDLVEIDAGDVMIYDRAGREEARKREEAAACRIFGLLPPDQARDMRLLWEEYEDRTTPEARFAYALDRVQPVLHNLNTQGLMWRKHGISRDQVMEINAPIAAARRGRARALGLRFRPHRRGRRKGASEAVTLFRDSQRHRRVVAVKA